MKRKAYQLFVVLVSLVQTANAQWTQTGNKIDGEANGDQFGRSISISGDGLTIAVGGHANDANGADAGHVRVLKYVTGAWVQQGADIDGEAASNYSGGSVSLSNDGLTVAIGAIGNNGFAGHTRVYKIDNGAWVQLGSDIDGSSGSSLGSSVSLSNDGLTVAIGAKSGGSPEKIYKYAAGSWLQQGGDIDEETSGDQSGTSISISGDGQTVAIGSPTSDANGQNSGLVRVFENVGGTWTQQGGNIEGEAAGDESGSAISLTDDGTTLAIGARLNGGNGTYSGHVRVYKNVGGTWTQQGTDIDGEAAGDQSGSSVSLSDDGLILAIGATGNFGTTTGGSPEGHARVYRYVSGSWVQLGDDFDGVAQGDAFGWSVSLSGDGLTFAVSAMTTGINKGSVNVYQHPMLINLVSSISIQGEAGASTISAPGGTLQMEAVVLPANATDATYTWSVINQTGTATIDANGLLTGLTVGDVKVLATATDASGTTGEALIDISNQTNGVNDKIIENSMAIYPNPATHQINISTLENIESITILDLYGRKIQAVSKTNRLINIASLTPGIYFLQVELDNTVVSKKFSKE